MWRLLWGWVDWRLSNFGPNREAHNERIKLVATSLNAVGLAALFGGIISPIFAEGGPRSIIGALVGIGVWAAF